MGRFRVSTSIARPIADVFGVLTDVEQTGVWFPGDVEEHWTTPPPQRAEDPGRAFQLEVDRHLHVRARRPGQ